MQLIWYLPSVIIGLIVGFSSGYWQLALMSVLMGSVMLSVQLYRNRYPPFDSGAMVHLSAGAVAIDNRVLPRYELFWKKQWHQLLLDNFRSRSAPDFLEQLLGTKFEQGFWPGVNPPLGLWLGASTSSEQTMDLSVDGPHLIIVGPTGSGKSELLKLILGSLIEKQQVDLILFDFKGGSTLERFKSVSRAMATDLDLAAAQLLWEFISGELVSRERSFAQSGVSDLGQFNLLGAPLRPMVVVIDEFSAALATGSKATSCIEDVCARGRSLGVHLIAATQSLTGIPRSLLTNLRARIAMSSADPIDLVQLGINPNKISFAAVLGWAQAVVVSAHRSPEGFYFPLGFMTKLKPEVVTEVREPPPPGRSRLLRQMYSDPEPELNPLEQQPSNPDSQLLSRMEALRLLEHK